MYLNYLQGPFHLRFELTVKKLTHVSRYFADKWTKIHVMTFISFFLKIQVEIVSLFHLKACANFTVMI